MNSWLPSAQRETGSSSARLFSPEKAHSMGTKSKLLFCTPCPSPAQLNRDLTAVMIHEIC